MELCASRFQVDAVTLETSLISRHVFPVKQQRWWSLSCSDEIRSFITVFTKAPSLYSVLNRLNLVHMLTPYFLKKKLFFHIRLGLASSFPSLLFSIPISSTSSKILGYIFLLLRYDHQTLIVVLLFRVLSYLMQCTHFSVTRSLPLSSAGYR
jgi:hypothetical protein